jgi:hypothetical protein
MKPDAHVITARKVSNNPMTSHSPERRRKQLGGLKNEVCSGTADESADSQPRKICSWKERGNYPLTCTIRKETKK